MQDTPVDFNIPEYQQFTDTDSDSTMQIMFKKLPLTEFDIISKNYHKFLKRTVQNMSPFPNYTPV